jgi:hypothetical protein
MLLTIALAVFAIQVIAWILLPASAGIESASQKGELASGTEIEPAYAANAWR